MWVALAVLNYISMPSKRPKKMLCQLRPHHPLRQAILFRLFIVCVVEVEQAIMAIMAIECALILSKATQLHSYVQVFDFSKGHLGSCSVAPCSSVCSVCAIIDLLTCHLFISLPICMVVLISLPALSGAASSASEQFMSYIETHAHHLQARL